MALTKVINDLADLNQSGSTNALKGCAGTTAEQPATSSSIDYLIVGGGGMAMGDGSGGGGAGGLLTGSTTVYHGTPTVITVGEGAPAKSTGYQCCGPYTGNGNDSGFNGIRALGGGSAAWRFAASGSWAYYTQSNGGGSGAGGGQSQGGAGSDSSLPGDGTSGQGFDGGASDSGASNIYATGGGGGAGGVGSTGSSGQSGNGGIGTDVTSFISVTNANLAQIGDTSNTTQVYFAGGGGGGGNAAATCGVGYSTLPGTGGLGGGGTGSNTNGGNGENGQTNTGGGGGGGAACGAGYGGAGGSGVTILKYDNTIVTGYTLNSEDTYTVNWPADKYGVAYWPLNLNVKDVGGHYDGTATDITYTNGHFNQAASFNGSSSYITLPNSVEVYKGTGKFAISAWFKTDTIPGTEQMLYCTFETAYLFIKLKASGVIEGQVAEATTGTGRVCETPTGTISAGIWYHVVFTGDTNDLRLYIDGTLSDSESTWNGTFYTSSSGCSIGSRNVGTNQFWDGEIEQVRIYSGPLTTSDVQDIYNNSKPGSLPPLTTASDISSISTLNYPSGTTGKALYQFQGNADELSDSALDFTNTSVSFTDGKFGEAATFDGTTSYLTLTSGLGSVANRTRSCWFYVDSVPSSFTTIIYIGESGSNSNYEVLSISAASSFQPRVRFQGRYGSSGSPSDSSIQTSWDIQAQTWYHAAWVYDGTTQSLYVNGILVGTATLTVTDTSSGITRVGAWRDGTPALDGKVDQLRFYNEALSADNIYKLWRETNIQTYITNTTSSTDANGTPANTDILVFKEGSGEITFKNDSPPGAEVGMLRYNSTLDQMEHFNSGGWKDFTNCTTSLCNYPTTAAALYQFTNNCNDTCGNYNGIPTNITYATGKYGQAGFFNGSGYVQIPYNFDFSGSFAISCWIKPNTVSNQWQSIIGTDGYGAATHSGFNFYLNYAVLEPWICVPSSCAGTGSGAVFQTGSVAVGVWQHIVLSRTYNSKWELFYNGSSLGINTSQALTTDLTSQGASYIGTHPTSFTYEFNGDIDQVRIFTTDLTAAQVTQLYNEVYCP